MVLSLAIVNDRGEALGFPFITFLAPGLIAMQIIQQAFSHTSSSIMIGKIQGNIVDILYAPLSSGEITLATILAACTRSIIIAAVSIVVFSLIIDLKFYNFYYIRYIILHQYRYCSNYGQYIFCFYMDNIFILQIYIIRVFPGYLDYFIKFIKIVFRLYRIKSILD